MRRTREFERHRRPKRPHHRSAPLTPHEKSRERKFPRGLRIGSQASPLRTTAPYGRPAHRLGDCAGRSPGLRVIAYRPAFPVSQWPFFGRDAHRSQLRGQPRLEPDLTGLCPCSLLPLRREPENQCKIHQPYLPRRSQDHAEVSERHRKNTRRLYVSCHGLRKLTPASVVSGDIIDLLSPSISQREPKP
jgi:hypothetical protein